MGLLICGSVGARTAAVLCENSLTHQRMVAQATLWLMIKERFHAKIAVRL